MTKLDITPLTPAIGAEIRGLDLATHLPDETIAAIRAAWLEHLVVFFPGQHLTPETQTAFAQRFGEITEAHPVEKSMPNQPFVHAIDSLKDRVDFWHTDVTFMSNPPAGSMLYAQQIPEVGGDTMWSSTRAAYDTLAPPLQELCENLTAIHYDPYYLRAVAEGNGQTWDGRPVDELKPVEHPMVRVHPETQRRNLFVNPKFTRSVKGFPHAQGKAFLQLLTDHMTQPPFTVRYRWAQGTLAFWDNRATMHYGVYDYEGSRRIMHRVTLRGDQPHGSATQR